MIPELIFAIFFGLLLLGIHRKIIARIQGRPGPPVWQEILHMLKFGGKKTWIPVTAGKSLFAGLIVIELGIWTTGFIVLFTGGNLIIIFGIYIFDKIVEYGLGLSSGSPYGKFAGARSIISAMSEVPLFVSIAGIVIFTHTLLLNGISDYQLSHSPLFIIAFPAAFAMFLVILAKMPSGPFSAVEGKEFISGCRTEHFGVFRAALMISDGLKIFVLLSTFIVVFFGITAIIPVIILMVLLIVILAFVCAFTPVLSPYDSVSIEMLVTGCSLAYFVILGVFL